MKRPMNFRLPGHSVHTLTELSEELDLSKTQVVEKALEFYARQMIAKQSKLARFAGPKFPTYP